MDEKDRKTIKAVSKQINNEDHHHFVRTLISDQVRTNRHESKIKGERHYQLTRERHDRALNMSKKMKQVKVIVVSRAVT